MRLKVLLSEGSSLSARQTITALGMAGYDVGVCDPDPMCIGRFSRFVSRFFRCPNFNDHPLEYVNFIDGIYRTHNYQVMIPVHEQAYLFARYRQLFRANVALADFASFQQVQGKISFARTLQKLDIPQPEYRVLNDLAQISEIEKYPFYLKTNYGTAGQGVWRIENLEKGMKVRKDLGSLDLSGQNQLMVQHEVRGDLCQVQAVFDRGNLVACHCTQTRGESIGGGHAARTGIDHPQVRQYVKKLGAALQWSGPIALDYIYDTQRDDPSFLEANPRLVEPMNACLSGVNFADLTVRVALGERIETMTGRTGVRSHSLMAILMAKANSGCSRWTLVKTLAQAAAGRGVYSDSREDLTPVGRDWLALIPSLFVLIRLLIDPRKASTISKKTVNNYSLSFKTIETME